MGSRPWKTPSASPHAETRRRASELTVYEHECECEDYAGCAGRVRTLDETCEVAPSAVGRTSAYPIHCLAAKRLARIPLCDKPHGPASAVRQVEYPGQSHDGRRMARTRIHFDGCRIRRAPRVGLCMPKHHGPTGSVTAHVWIAHRHRPRRPAVQPEQPNAGSPEGPPLDGAN